MSIDQLKGMASGKLGFARSNQFAVQLPTEFASSSLLQNIASFALTGQGLGGGDLNILCTNASLPGKQVLVQDRRIGMEYQKVANGYAVDDVSMTFYVLNDYGIKKYFDNWYERVVVDDLSIAPYKNEYARDVKIMQLRRAITSRSFNVGPINIGADIGLLFQIVDDLIDYSGSSKVAGKKTRKDLKKGKATLISLSGHQNTIKYGNRIKYKIFKRINNFGKRSEDLKDTIKYILERKK